MVVYARIIENIAVVAARIRHSTFLLLLCALVSFRPVELCMKLGKGPRNESDAWLLEVT